MIEPYFIVNRMPRARWKEIRRRAITQEKWMSLICATLSLVTSALAFAAGMLVAREYFIITLILIPCAVFCAIWYVKYEKQLKNLNE